MTTTQPVVHLQPPAPAPRALEPVMIPALAPEHSVATVEAPRSLVAARLDGDVGMATAEYAIATLAACGFAGLLLAVLTSDTVRQLLVSLIQRALSIA